MDKKELIYFRKLIKEATIINNVGTATVDRGDEGEYNTKLETGVLRRDIHRLKDGQEEFDAIQKKDDESPNPEDISINGGLKAPTKKASSKRTPLNELQGFGMGVLDSQVTGAKYNVNELDGWGYNNNTEEEQRAVEIQAFDGMSQKINDIGLLAGEYMLIKTSPQKYSMTPEDAEEILKKNGRWKDVSHYLLGQHDTRAFTSLEEKPHDTNVDEATTVAGMGGWGAFGYDAPAFMVPQSKKKKKLEEKVKLPLNGEYLYTNEGVKVTPQMVNEWFDEVKGDEKPSFNGGKLVQIDPKCNTFPYCSQGAVDKPIKLIGETKDTMCEGAWSYITEIAKEVKATPELVAKIIREAYLK